MLTKMWSNRNTHSLLVGKQNSTATLEGSSVLSYKTKHTLKPYNPAVTLTWYLLNRVENLSLHRTQHTDVSTSFIGYYQNLETWERFFSRWLNKQTVTHSDNRMLFSSKKEWALQPWNDMEESYTPSINWKKKSQSEKATYYVIPTVLYAGKDKTMKAARSMVARDWGMKGWTREAQRIFRAVKIVSAWCYLQ